MTALYFILIGLAIGTYGTIVGLGGGFALMPILLILFPKLGVEIITGTSLSVIFFNSLSGTIAYARMKKIDYRSGIIFALAVCPGAVLGAWTSKYIPRNIFDLIFGIVLIALSLFLILKKPEEETEERKNKLNQCGKFRKIVAGSGKTYEYYVNETLGIILCFVIGWIASTLGVGGGIMYVPLLICLLKFPCRIATATSIFIALIMALTASLTHLMLGNLSGHLPLIIELGIGVILGAQIGARLSKKLKGTFIVRLLALALLAAAIRLLI